MTPPSRRLLVLATAVATSGSTSQAPVPCDGPPPPARAGTYTVSHFESGRRGCVPYTVYLPPGWSTDTTTTYPLIVFMHGQYGDERTFPLAVPADDLNDWIRSERLPPFVLIAPRGSDDRRRIQWYQGGNVTMLVSEGPAGLRAHARAAYRAGFGRQVSLHGQSRGATGALFFALAYPERFASSVANSFVSEYAVDRLNRLAERNHARLVDGPFPLRMTIGSADEGIAASVAVHEHLERLGITHEYSVLPGVTHRYDHVWEYVFPDTVVAGLRDLQFHAEVWDARP